ncbi:MAG: hypothetical protein ACREPB_16030, partial [Arenimonas sp.]
MRNHLQRLWVVSAFFLVGIGAAQTAMGTQPFEEYSKRIKSAQNVAPLSSNLFGESISLYNGATEFAVTDIDLPGNNALPVRLGRRYKVQATPSDAQSFGGFGSWDIDVPFIHGTFLGAWNAPYSSANRCTNFERPYPTGVIQVEDYWSGTKLYFPGQGDLDILRLNSLPKVTLPSDGNNYVLGTKSFHRIRCKSTTANGFAGEGFVVLDSNGVKYTFDIGLTRQAGVIKKRASEYGYDQVGRTEVYLAISRMEDRFGNWVNYQWSGNQLSSITASDGRAINLTWSNGVIVSAQAETRTWTYQYNSTALTKVILPDTSAYTYQFPAGIIAPFYPTTDFDTEDSRCIEPLEAGGGNFTLTATHPSGAVGQFEFEFKRHRRSGIPESVCTPYQTDTSGFDNRSYYALAVPDYFDLYSITKKTITGAALPTQQWQYGYEIIPYGRTPIAITPCTSCQDAKSVTVDQPDGTRQEHRFGVLWSGNDGRLLEVITRKADGTIVRKESSRYLTSVEVAAMPFPDVYGWSLSTDDATSVQIRPIAETTVRQDGNIAGPQYFGLPAPAAPTSPQADAYTRTTTSFDIFARPSAVISASVHGNGSGTHYSRTDVTSYHDNLSRWVLGQVQTVTNTNTSPNVVLSQTDYDPATALPLRIYSFGQTQPDTTFTYLTDGNISTVKDALNHTTTLSN